MVKNRGYAGYHLGEKLYDSLSSVLYKTRSRKQTSKTILKILKSDSPSDKEAIRFHQEFSIANQINSPYVEKVFGLINERNFTALLIEDIDGKSLDIWFRQQPPSILEGLNLAISICQGIRSIHDAKIIHKDISSSNIIWNRQTNDVKIIDFGIATNFARENITPLAASKLEGDLLYMSPEQTGRMNSCFKFI